MSAWAGPWLAGPSDWLGRLGNRAAGSPVDLLVNGTLVARGEVVVIDEEVGYITGLGPRMRLGERVDSLKGLLAQDPPINPSSDPNWDQNSGRPRF